MTDIEKRESVLAAARQVFLRYGFKRTTMGDIAAEARISRPALYLLFSSKEDVFGAVMERLFTETLTRIRDGLGAYATAYEQLVFAFDVWAVQPFAAVRASPDAGDMLESSYAFAPAVTARATAEFERLLAGILEPLAAQAQLGIAPDRIARILIAAAPGFKAAASSVEQLRHMIEDVARIVLAGLRAPA